MLLLLHCGEGSSLRVFLEGFENQGNEKTSELASASGFLFLAISHVKHRLALDHVVQLKR